LFFVLNSPSCVLKYFQIHFRFRWDIREFVSTERCFFSNSCLKILSFYPLLEKCILYSSLPKCKAFRHYILVFWNQLFVGSGTGIGAACGSGSYCNTILRLRFLNTA
jgi:hypothetical protein